MACACIIRLLFSFTNKENDQVSDFSFWRICTTWLSFSLIFILPSVFGHCTVWHKILAGSNFCSFYSDPQETFPQNKIPAKTYSTGEITHTNITSRILLLPFIENVKTIEWETKRSEIKKKSTGKDRPKIIHSEGHSTIEWHWLLVCLCFTSLHFLSLVNCMNFNLKNAEMLYFQLNATSRQSKQLGSSKKNQYFQ